MELVHRAVVIVKCIVSCTNQKRAERIYASQISDVLMAISMPQLEQVPAPIKQLAATIVESKKDYINGNNHASSSEDSDDGDNHTHKSSIIIEEVTD
jgi:hypothetical protein